MKEASESPNDPLVKYIGSLRNEIRIAIIRFLSSYQDPSEFNEIQREIERQFGSPGNLSYHLNILKENMMITGDEQGYQLTEIGAKTFSFLESMNGLLKNDAPILIRTSKYSLETFDESIIEKNLQLEANMPLQKAKKIANEAKQRLKKAKITYLTTPLVREYINAILIENHYEDYRAKLTRLGLPPYDVEKMLTDHNVRNPRHFKADLGRHIQEQYVLLNLLQQKYADTFLSGQFSFTNLANFGFSPLELILSGHEWEAILHRYAKYASLIPSSQENCQNLFELPFRDFLSIYERLVKELHPFFPHGMTLLRFDLFLEGFLSAYKPSELEELLQRCALECDGPWDLTLGVSLITNYVELSPLFELYLQELTRWKANPRKNPLTLPHLVIHAPKQELKTILETTNFATLTPFLQTTIQILAHPQVCFDQFSKWGWPKADHTFTNLEIPIPVETYRNLSPSIVIEKISINLLVLYQLANKEDDTFFQLLESAIFRVFDFMEYKCTLLLRNLVNFSQWAEIQSILFPNQSAEKIFTPTTEDTSSSPPNRNTTKGSQVTPILGAVTFHGLEEMILLKSQLFLRMQSENRKFAVKILDFIQRLLDKQNLMPNNRIQYLMAENSPRTPIAPPNTQIFEEVSSVGEKIHGEPISAYRHGFHTSLTPLTLSSIHQIYSDLNGSFFKEITLNYTFPDSPANISPASLFSILQKLLDTKMCRIQFQY